MARERISLDQVRHPPHRLLTTSPGPGRLLPSMVHWWSRAAMSGPTTKRRSVVGMAGSTIAVVPVLALLALFAVDRWVYVDAQAHAERGTPVVFSSGNFRVDSPGAWALGCLILWIIFFPLYLASRGHTG